MKKINLKGILEVLNEKELKNVMGGSGNQCTSSCSPGACGSGRCEIDYQSSRRSCHCKY
jgi:natural product precursor